MASAQLGCSARVGSRPWTTSPACVEGDRPEPVRIGRRPGAPRDRRAGGRGRPAPGPRPRDVGPCRRLARDAGRAVRPADHGLGGARAEERRSGHGRGGDRRGRRRERDAVPARRRGLRSEPRRQPVAQRWRLRRVRGGSGCQVRAEAGRPHVRTGRGRSHVRIARGPGRSRRGTGRGGTARPDQRRGRGGGDVRGAARQGVRSGRDRRRQRREARHDPVDRRGQRPRLRRRRTSPGAASATTRSSTSPATVDGPTSDVRSPPRGPSSWSGTISTEDPAIGGSGAWVASRG